MKVLVTGGGGMLGKSLQKIIRENKIDNDSTLCCTESIGDKYDFIFLTRNDGDLRIESQVEDIFNKHNPNIVIHLASQVGGVYDNLSNNYKYLMDNTSIHCNIINMCKKYKVKKIINILSTCIFPNENVSYPLTSVQLHNGLPHYSNIGYAYSKRFLQVASSILKNETDIQVINLTPTNLYGENDNYNLESAHVIPALIHKAYIAKQNNTSLYIKGTGDAYRQFLYIDDLANIILKFIYLNSTQKEINCIASPNVKDEIQIKSIIEKIVDILQFKGEIIYDKSFSNGQIKKTTSDDELLFYLGAFKFTNIDIGLKNTINYFIENYKVIRK